MISHAPRYARPRSPADAVDDYGAPVDPGSFMDLVSGVDRSGGKIADEALKMGYLHLDQKTKEEYRQKDFWGKLRSGNENRVTPAERRKVEEEKALEERRLEVSDLAEGSGVIKGRDGRPDMKVVAETKAMDVAAEVHYVPLGLCVDAQGARYTMAGLRARRLVILGQVRAEKAHIGDTAASNIISTSSLATHCSLVAGGRGEGGGGEGRHRPARGEGLPLERGLQASPRREDRS